MEVKRLHTAKLAEVKRQAFAEYRGSENFVTLIDKKVMDQYDDFLYRVKWYNAR